MSQRKNPTPPPVSPTPAQPGRAFADWLKVILGPVLGAVLGVAGGVIAMEISIARVQEKLGSLEDRLKNIHDKNEERVQRNAAAIEELRQKIDHIQDERIAALEQKISELREAHQGHPK